MSHCTSNILINMYCKNRLLDIKQKIINIVLTERDNCYKCSCIYLILFMLLFSILVISLFVLIPYLGDIIFQTNNCAESATKCMQASLFGFFTYGIICPFASFILLFPIFGPLLFLINNNKIQKQKYVLIIKISIAITCVLFGLFGLPLFGTIISRYSNWVYDKKCELINYSSYMSPWCHVYGVQFSLLMMGVYAIIYSIYRIFSLRKEKICSNIFLKR